MHHGASARATMPRDALARNSAPLATPTRRVAPKAALAAYLKGGLGQERA